jgi:hypothetical protein
MEVNSIPSRMHCAVPRLQHSSDTKFRDPSGGYTDEWAKVPSAPRRKVEQSLTHLRSLELLALAKMAWIRTDNVAKVLCTMDELRWTCCRLPSASSMLFCIYLILFVSLCFVGVHCTRSVPTIPASLEILCHSLWWRSIPCSVAQGLLGIVDCGRLWNNAKLCYSYNYLIQEPSKVFV